MQEGEKSHASRGRILLRRKRTRALYCNSVAPCVFWKTHSWDVRRCSPGPQVSPRTTVKVEDPSDGEEGSRDCATLGVGGLHRYWSGNQPNPRVGEKKQTTRCARLSSPVSVRSFCMDMATSVHGLHRLEQHSVCETVAMAWLWQRPWYNSGGSSNASTPAKLARCRQLLLGLVIRNAAVSGLMG
ncbi:hypothetical protein BR93DRAFT_161789 [Coniochaeta sp. PMI_546]|nr:hypothetical protein BR93DRAFT_161789 [Coniochaeta sp. PMI_546]